MLRGLFHLFRFVLDLSLQHFLHSGLRGQLVIILLQPLLRCLLGLGKRFVQFLQIILGHLLSSSVLKYSAKGGGFHRLP